MASDTTTTDQIAMASDTTTADQPKAGYTIRPREFNFTHGEWLIGETAALVRGTKVVATTLFDTERLDSDFMNVSFGISKPEEYFGWANGDLQLRVEMAHKTVTRNINANYLQQTPGGSASFYLVGFLLPTGTTEKMLRISVVDETEHPKGGLILHWVEIITPGK